MIYAIRNTHIESNDVQRNFIGISSENRMPCRKDDINIAIYGHRIL